MDDTLGLAEQMDMQTLIPPLARIAIQTPDNVPGFLLVIKQGHPLTCQSNCIHFSENTHVLRPNHKVPFASSESEVRFRNN